MGLFDRFRLPDYEPMECPLCQERHIGEFQTKAFYNPYLRNIAPQAPLPDDAEMFIERGWIGSGTSCPPYTGKTPQDAHRWIDARLLIEDGVWTGRWLYIETDASGNAKGEWQEAPPARSALTPTAGRRPDAPA